jgi:HK97 family phage portal protein
MPLPFLGRKAAAHAVNASPVASIGLPSMTPWPTTSVKRLIKEGYEANVTAYTCISLAARTAAGVPWCLFQKRGARLVKTLSMAEAAKAWQRGSIDRRFRKAVELAEVDNHPALTLWENPNPDLSRDEFVEAWMSYLLISGDTYTELVPTRRGIGELWPLPSARIRIAPDAEGRVAAYIFDIGNGKEIRFDADEVMHGKTFNPDGGLYGLSPLRAAARHIDTANAAALWNWNVLSNYGMPPGGFVSDKPLTEPRFQELKRMVRKLFSGAENARKPLVLDGGLTWQVFSQSAAELDWLNGSKLSARQICAALHVAPELAGDGEVKTYANAKEARKALYQERVMPDLDKLKALLNKYVAPRFDGNLLFDYDRDQIEALQEEQTALYDRLGRADWLSVNEKREATGWDETEGGDVVLVDAGKVPLQMVGQTGDGAEGGDVIEGTPVRRALNPAPDDADAVAAAEKALERIKLRLET